jgi:hypothetical protein
MKMVTKIVRMLLAVVLLASGASMYAAPEKSSVPATAIEAADLAFMREEEKLARDVYLTFFERWNLAVFSNIASSEQMHTDAVLKLLNYFKLPDPAAGKAIGEFTNPTLQALYYQMISLGSGSSLAALKVGSTIEEKDMKDINDAIQRATNPGIKSVYESLLCGSRNHLRGFEQNIKQVSGAYYYANILPPAEVDAIINSAMERCG